MNEYEVMNIRYDGLKESRFLKAYNDAPENLRKCVLLCLELHDDNVGCKKECRVYDFNSYLKERV